MLEEVRHIQAKCDRCSAIEHVDGFNSRSEIRHHLVTHGWYLIPYISEPIDYDMLCPQCVEAIVTDWLNTYRKGVIK